MAEAVADDPLEPADYFCHKCKTEITHVDANFNCPTCKQGFIEQLDESQAQDMIEDSEEDEEVAGFEIFEHYNDLFGLGMEQPAQQRDQLRHMSAGPLSNWTRSRYRPGEYEPFDNVIQDLIVNVTGIGWGPVGPGGRGNGPVFFVGNPGDYAWGREGLDAIVTQLLNQMDVTGPPPLDKEKIQNIPTVLITQDQAGKTIIANGKGGVSEESRDHTKLQCSVCWEDFIPGEKVRQLECEHVYHEPCIIPWLELHGTCPICRKTLLRSPDDRPPPVQGPIGGLSAFFRNAFTSQQFNPSTSSHETSANGPHTSQSTPSRRARPPRDNDMDFEFD